MAASTDNAHTVASVFLYLTDFGVVRLGPKAKKLPRRKNGDFDRRFTACRKFIGDLGAEAHRVYKSSRTARLRYFDGGA